MKPVQQFDAKFASFFKKGYSKKMGGTQTIVLPNGQSFFFDDRQYYNGRGAKYNNDNMHENLGDILVTQKEVKELSARLRERGKNIKKAEKERKEREKVIKAAEKKGIYELTKNEYGTFVELSDNERLTNAFDAKRLANTLKISVQDAELLKSEGKTYVYAKTEDGNIIELYHSDLSCNNLSISVDFKGKEFFEQKLKQRSEWVNAPFAELIGQTGNINHFVC